MAFSGKRRGGTGRGALAALASTAGVGFATGREIALFYTQTGLASWAGIALSGTVFGLLTGLCARLARRSGAAGLPRLCRLRLGRVGRRVVGLCHALLLALAAASMLARAGALGALMLPLPRGCLWGMALSLLLAGMLAAGGGRRMPGPGLALLGVAATFYAALALDGRPPRLYWSGEVVPSLSGSLLAAAALALCHGALCACLAADSACRWAAAGARPGRLGAFCGAGLGLILASGNAALIRGGEKLLALGYPLAPLAARWGLFGFWLTAGFGFAASTATLAAALTGLTGWLRRDGISMLNVENPA